jgi:hypothetical protein
MQGDDYQARWFWLQACRLFEERPTVERVGYELALAKAFDDVVSFYGHPVPDERNDPVDTDCFQAKSHVDQAGAFTCQALTEPGFINAERFSILERLRQARDTFAQQARRGRFTILSPWGIDPGDPLRELVSTQGGELRLHVLQEGGPRSAMGHVRALWREHLGLDSDGALEEVLRPLRIRHGVGDMGLIRDLLNARLKLAGMRAVDDDHVVHPYDELSRKLLQRDVREFDRATLQEIVEREQLWRGREVLDPGPVRLGIRSFMRFAEYMEDETDAMVSLVHHFDNRYIRDERLWHAAVYPEVAAFLTANVRAGGSYRLQLDCHTSIAFAVGYSLDPKVGADISFIQKTPTNAFVWRSDERAPRGDAPLWSMAPVGGAGDGRDVAVAISLTHAVDADVELYVRRQLPSVGRILGFALQPEPSRTAVRDGAHALQLVRDLLRRMQETRTLDERQGMLHIFGALPNGFAFLLGREARLLGPCAIYEHDFDRMRPGGYLPGMQFPPPGAS